MPAPTQPLQFVFFDIGNTLGRVDAAGEFTAFGSTKALLRSMRDGLGLRVGVISNLPDTMTRAQAQALLDGAGLGTFLDPHGLVTNHDAGADKPQKAIYEFAAAQVDVPIGQCLYVGEDASEVAGAIAAGMQAVLKPVPAA
jgi:FMN phosphatase YigB (HAD superfamily)